MPEKMTDTSSGMRKMTMQMKTLEVEVVRVKITLACTDCKQRNYNMTKEKKNHPERMETKKYCKFCHHHDHPDSGYQCNGFRNSGMH